MFDLREVSRMVRSQGVWVGLSEDHQVDEVSIALYQGSLQPVPRTPAVDQAAPSREPGEPGSRHDLSEVAPVDQAVRLDRPVYRRLRGTVHGACVPRSTRDETSNAHRTEGYAVAHARAAGGAGGRAAAGPGV